MLQMCRPVSHKLAAVRKKIFVLAAVLW